MATPEQTDATGALAAHAASLAVDDMPAAVVERAKLVVADTIGIMLAASRSPAVEIALATFPLDGGPCTVVGRGRGAGPDRAAFLNGISTHELELDDSHAPSRTHPAAVVVPAALAAAEAAGCPPGKELLAGVVAGYDVEARLSRAIGVQRQFDRGFHPASVCGSVGAAVAAARILGLDVERIRVAIALAASQSSGLMAWQEDPTHMVKSFQMGIAARNGLYGALLARAGFGGVRDVLTGKHSLPSSFGGRAADAASLVDGLGERYEIAGTSIKLHACGGQTHAAIDALLELVAEHDLRPDDIASIDVQLAHDAVPVVDGNPLLSANVQYVLAVVAHERHAGPELFADGRPRPASVDRLAASVSVRGNDELQAAFPERKGAIVTVRTSTGARVSARRPAPHGNPADPLSEGEVRAKFARLAGSVLERRDADSLWTFLHDLDEQGRTDDLFLLSATKGLVTR